MLYLVQTDIKSKLLKMFSLITPTSNLAKSKSQRLFSDLMLLQHIDLFVKVHKWVSDQGYWNELHVSLQTGLYSAVSRAVMWINLLVLIESYIAYFKERENWRQVNGQKGKPDPI